MITPKGYKDTPVGVIPQEWEVVHLKDLGEVHSGGTPDTDTAEYWDGNICWCTPTDVTSLQTRYISETAKKITKIGLKNSSAFLLPINSVVVCTRATIGNVAITKNELSTNQGFKNIIPRLCDSEWLFYILMHSKNSLKRLGCGSTFPEVSKRDFENLNLPLPPLAEQKKIAEILCTWDDALEKQSKLIDKLELRKRGLMKCLLTGKTRLPGFTEPWINIRIGELCLMKRGEILVSDDYIFGDIPVIAGGKEPAGFHNISNRNGNIITISSSGASAGFVAFYEKPIFATDCFTISSSEKYNVRFFYYYLMMSQERIYRLQSGGAQPHVHPKDLAPMMLRIPSLEEQNAVVKIILSSDKEIETQRKKLEALRQQKQGLMQQLLTGKTRVKI